MERKNAWKKYSDEDKNNVFTFADEYKTFISECKTERECVKKAVELAKKAGYRDLQEIIAANETLKAGDKVYAVNMKKAIVLFNIGSEPISTGMNILGAHIDSPRLDIKQNPMYEDSDLVLLDTHYYGGIKKYQWVAIPLALHGVVALKNGECVEVVIGEDVCDAVVGVSDLLIHLCTKQEYYDALIRVCSQPRRYTLTDAALETLSIIAYKQPVTKIEIENIRGVNSDRAVSKLVELGLVKEVGRLDAPGRPMLFGTTEDFLRSFGVQSIDELPTISEDMVEQYKEEAELELASESFDADNQEDSDGQITLGI